MASDKRDNAPNDAPRSQGIAPGGVPVFNRLARAGSGGLAAATIGWTLALCIVGGALAGIALDKHFGTSYWTPVLFLLGVAAGFIQMVRTLGDANRLEERERSEKQQTRAEVATNTPMQAATPPVTVRMGRIPAPPIASFDASGTPNAPVALVELPQDVSDDLARLREMLAQERGEKKDGDATR